MKFTAFILLFGVCFPYALALDNVASCKDKCVANFDSTEEDACKRGCEYAGVAKSSENANLGDHTCEDSCRDAYSDQTLKTRCNSGCDYSKQTSATPTRWHVILSHGNDALASFGRFCHVAAAKTRLWFHNIWSNIFGHTPNSTASLTHVSTTPKITPTARPEHMVAQPLGNHMPIVITRVRIFGGIFVPRSNLQLENEEEKLAGPHHLPPALLPDAPRKPIEDLMRESVRRKFIQVGHQQHMQEPLLHQRSYHHIEHTSEDYFSCLMHRVLTRPVLLLMAFSLSLIFLMLIVHLVLRVRRQARANRIRYTPLPTYAEALSIKVPLMSDDGKKEAKLNFDFEKETLEV